MLELLYEKNDYQSYLVESKLVCAFNYRWQYPAQTEEAAFRSAMGEVGGSDYLYIGYPWATLIDLLRRKRSDAYEFLFYFNKIANKVKGQSKKIVTVCQHIDAEHFFELFACLGITDLFWPHARNDCDYKTPFKIHPFPLFPAQAHEFEVSGNDKVYISNFIGASGKSYLSNLRDLIFEDKRLNDGRHVIRKREGWHYERSVYLEQVMGVRASEEQRQDEKLKSDEYVDAIRRSKFTLCPTGTGPNSIRLFEAINLNSIPVILTKSLLLVSQDQDFIKGCIIVDDSNIGLDEAIAIMENMDDAEYQERIAVLRILADRYSPSQYIDFIVNRL